MIEEVIEEGTEEDGLIVDRMRIGNVKWRIIGVYISGDIENKLDILEE